MKIINVVGTRPNFMKIAPIIRELNKHPEIEHKLVHTGQHYDEKMSKVFFENLSLPKPDYYLGIGSGTHSYQTARIMIEFEPILAKEKPDLVIVAGDVNSTLACALTAKKMGIKVAHIEAGLRSFDMDMPEEINRILVDRISDYLFVSEQSGIENLVNEGTYKNQIYFVGNIMIDSLKYCENSLPKVKVKQDYMLATLHRPSNVDNPKKLKSILESFNELSREIVILFPVHPRTLEIINAELKDFRVSPNLLFMEPMGYLEFISYLKKSKLVLTDSGGIQEESSYLKVPCITIRQNTERPITLTHGTNHLTSSLDKYSIKHIKDILSGKHKIKSKSIPLWDGKTAERIIEVLTKPHIYV